MEVDRGWGEGDGLGGTDRDWDDVSLGRKGSTRGDKCVESRGFDIWLGTAGK